MNFMLYEVKQRRFTKLNTHFLPYWPLQKKAIDESGGMKWCDWENVLHWNWEGCKFEIHYEHLGELGNPTSFCHEILGTYNSK